MHRIRWGQLLAVALAVALVVALGPAVTAADRDGVDFGRDVLPLLSDRCFHCHGPDPHTREADLRLDTHEGALSVIDLEDVGDSELLARITSEDDDERMPPAESHRKPLSQEQVARLRDWIEDGAKYQKHWAFVPPVRTDPPSVNAKSWVRNPIDSFVLARLEKEQLNPSPETEKATLIRRLSLDLTGLPPTIEEVDAFLADTSTNAYEKLVDRLLASPRYGEHMALAWLDAARYADTNGYQHDGTRTMWPWRDWVVQALNDNMPFDRFTTEQLAGDLLPNPTPTQVLATGLHRNHMLNGEGGRDPEESRVEYVVDRVSTTGAIWMGLTLGCCRCHDHKYDPVSQQEFYQFYAFFNNIDESGGVDGGGNAQPVAKSPRLEDTRRFQKLSNRLISLTQQISAEPTSEQLARWAQSMRTQMSGKTAYWVPLVPKSLVSQAQAAITLEDDGVIMVTGKNAPQDDYRLKIDTSAANITGLRLEALPHDSFTNGGLARSDSGNFVLTGIEVEAAEPGAKQPESIAIGEGEADYYQRGYPIEHAIDGQANTGWAVLSADMRQPRTAVFVFEKPIVGGPGTQLTVSFRHQSKNKFHNIGRFRLAVTTFPRPSLGLESAMPADGAALLRADTDQLLPDQRARMVAWYRSTDYSLAEFRAEAARIRRSLDAMRERFVETMVLRDRKDLRPTYRLLGGQWDQPDKSHPLNPGVPAAIALTPEITPPNRLGLARWLLDPKQPLTARVTVNRYWQHFFGAGLVTSVDDFGLQGKQPSHPQLLDWLATEFIRSDWNVKAMHRMIVNSATYRQSSRTTPAMLERDLYNRLLARGPRFRLSSQAIRDQALALSGLLLHEIGGPPVRPYQPEGVWLDMTLGKIKYEQDSGESLYRRSLYTFWRRTVGPTMFFDAATRQVCQMKPGRTNTPLHALTLMNDVTYVEAGRKFGERMLNEGGTTPEQRITWAMRTATSRLPTSSETNTLGVLLEKLLARYRDDLAAATRLVSLGQSQRDATLDVSELAAYSVLANVILNLDEVLTKE